MTGREQIEELCRRLGRAHAERDASGIVDCYAPDALIYNLAPPLSTRGLDLDETAAWLATWSSPILIDAEEVETVVSDALAWVTALNRMHGTKTDGTAIDIWFRTTMCFRKLGGVWKIVHDHASTPFCMDGSFRAAVDLEPRQRTQ
jgi:ketosteroid isomerase-like protein